jgi:hypothetical protein
MGIDGALCRRLRTTNAIEILNGSIAHFLRDVRRWKDGAMTLRWVTGALADAKQRLRRLRGHRDMRGLLAASQAHTECVTDAELKAA